MPFIKLGADLNEVPEEAPVPQGKEYPLEIIQVGDVVDAKESDRQVQRIMIRITDPDYADASPIFHYLTYPMASDFVPDEETGVVTANMLLRNVKRFLHVFGVEWGEEGFDDEDLAHAQGTCLLGMDSYEGNDRNVLKLPKIR